MSSQAALVNLQTTGIDSRREHMFYTGMATACLLTILAGFGKSYYFRAFTDASPIPAFVHLHATVFTIWVLLFLTQTALVAVDNIDLHRRLGIAGGVLAGPVVVLGYETALYGARNGWNPGGPFPDSLAFLAIGLTDLLLFSVFIVTALSYRRRPEAHKRLMLLAVIGGLLWPAITRIPYVRGRAPLMFGLIVLFVLAGPVFDLVSRRRVHAVYLWGGSLILASFPIRTAIGLSDGWRRFAAWLIG
jgi:hypothetical protein